MLLARLRPRTKPTTKPVFYADRLRRLLAGDTDRTDPAFADQASVDDVTWNVFGSLDTDDDRGYLATLLQPLAGADLAAPVRILLWTGRHREPLLRPSPAYVRRVHERAGPAAKDELAEFVRPIEVPVRIESPRVIALVDTTLDTVPRGAGGRERLVELVDAGLEHARSVSKTLTVAVVYRSGGQAAAELSARVNRLRDPAALAAALPWRASIPEVRFRELSWQQLLQTWVNERDHFDLYGQPVRAFLARCDELGLR